VPSKDPAQRFEDILENIALIEEFTAGMDLTASQRTSRPSMRLSAVWNGSARRPGNSAARLRNCAPLFPGPNCAA